MRFYELLRLDEGLNFVDQTAIKQFLATASEGVENQEGKTWLTSKTMVKSIMDREDCATAIDPNSLDGSEPTWVHQAIDRGETLYDFSPSPELEEQISHIKDWLNNIASVKEPAKDDPNYNEKHQFFFQCQKDLKSLSKFNLDTAFEKAEASVEEMNKVNLDTAFEKAEASVEEMNKVNAKANAASQTSQIESNKNFKVIKRFDSGCVAVELITKAALQDEGNKMSHCVGGNGYWKSVEAGKTQIYSIRTPQGESAATIEVDGNRTRQVKGKGNRAPVPKYIDMAVELLNQVGAKGDCNDLSAAGVMFSNSTGKYGTFMEVAELIVDKPPIQVYKSDDKLLLYSTKIGMIVQKMLHSQWSYNKELTPSELKSYAGPVRSLINKFSPLNKEPDHSLQPVLDAFNSIFDPKDNMVKGFDRDLMTEIMTTTAHGIQVLRRGSSFFVGKGDNLVKLTTSQNLRWMRDDIAEMANEIDGFYETASGRYGNITLPGWGLALIEKGTQVPTIEHVLYETGDIQIGVSDNTVKSGHYNESSYTRAVVMFEKGEPVGYVSSGTVTSCQFGGVPVRANQWDAWNAAVQEDLLPKKIKNKLVHILKDKGYDVEMDDDFGIGYRLNTPAEVGQVKVELKSDRYRQFLEMTFPVGDGQQEITFSLNKDTDSENGFAIKDGTYQITKGGELGVPEPSVSQDIIDALKGAQVPIEPPTGQSKIFWKQLGIQYSKKEGFILDDSLRAKVVYKNGPVEVTSKSSKDAHGTWMTYQVSSSGDKVAEVVCMQMSNTVRISEIHYQDDTEGPEAVADFINEKGKELKILPPKAKDPAKALLPYGLMINNGEITVSGFDPIKMAWENGKVPLNDVYEGAFAHLDSRRGGREDWRIFVPGPNTGKPTVIGYVQLQDHHVEKSSTTGALGNGSKKKIAMRLLRKFMELLDHVTEDGEDND